MAESADGENQGVVNQGNYAPAQRHRLTGDNEGFEAELDKIEKEHSGLEQLEKQETNILWVESQPDCAVCLQKCHYPIQLPCTHVFCFLCAKGVSARGRRCALCRAGIPADYFDKPMLIRVRLKDDKSLATHDSKQGEKQEEYKWYYEGRNGWWQYEDRACIQLEDDFNKEKRTSELLIAGFIYIVDLVNMVQIRKNYPSRRRRIKRDRACAQKKGIAGLKNVEQDNTAYYTTGAAYDPFKENEGVEDDSYSCESGDKCNTPPQGPHHDEDVERVTDNLDRTL